MIKNLFLYLFPFIIGFSHGQNALGTVFIDEGVFDAYTLISSNNKAYLFNNCGQVINEWTSSYTPGNSVYLLPNGNLLRAGRVNDVPSTLTFGGQGGVVELYNWEGDLLWSYLHISNDFRQHHDVYPMPNGNVLILAATVMSSAEALAAGRDPNNMNDLVLYNERIFEVEPVGTNDVNVVWEWNVKDHLIQDFDTTKNNFGDVSMNPGRLDINFLNGRSGEANWLHFNSIQYNNSLDQIVISSRNLSEFYIIDHSTTIEESASNTGGTYGNGGDFLYRWGNPIAYRQGTVADQILFGQHYPHYIEDGLIDAGKILVFNNGNGRIPEFSNVAIIEPPTITPGVYDYAPNTAFGPLAAEYSYSDLSSTPSEFFSPILSSAQRLPNGNTLICEGRSGEIFEIDSNDNLVWKYIVPNSLFRAIKYAPDYEAFIGRDLTPNNTLEPNQDITACLSLGINDIEFVNLKIYPNPTSDYINITATTTIDKVELYSILGQKVYVANNTSTIDVSRFDSGVYFIQLHSGNDSITKKIIIQ